MLIIASVTDNLNRHLGLRLIILTLLILPSWNISDNSAKACCTCSSLLLLHMGFHSINFAEGNEYSATHLEVDSRYRHWSDCSGTRKYPAFKLYRAWLDDVITCNSAGIVSFILLLRPSPPPTHTHTPPLGLVWPGSTVCLSRTKPDLVLQVKRSLLFHTFFFCVH